MSKHNERGCPLPMEVIAKFRRRIRLEVRAIYPSPFTNKQRRAIVTERVLHFMEKFRYYTILDDYFEEGME